MKVIKNSIIYSIVSILQKALGFFLLPVYTVYLTTADYGIVNVVTSIVSLISIFYMLSLNGAATRFHFKYKDDENAQKEIWGTVFTFVLINSVLLTSVIIALKHYILLPFVKGIDYYPYLFLGLLSILISPIFLIYQAYLQTRQEGKIYGISTLLYFLCNIALTIFFIVLFDFRALGVLLALFLTNLIFAIGTFIVFVPKIKLGINKKYFVDLMKYSLPLIPHSVSGWLITLLDRLFLNNMKSAASVGIYSIGYQFGNIMNVITYSINQAYVPWFFEIVENKDTSKDRLIKASEMIIWGYSFIALTITLFTPEVLSLMVSKGFRDGWVVVPFLCFANVFNGLYYIAANVLWLDKTVLMPIITVTSAFISVFLNYILIPKYGIIGAAISNLAALFIVSIIAIMLAHNVSRIGFNWIKLYLIIFINFALSFIVFLKQYIANPMFIIIKILIILFIMLFLYVKYKIYIKHIVALIYDKCIVYRNIILNKNLS